MEIILLKAVSCRRCGRIFYICRSCWRGQAYCCDSCRHHSRREAHRLAQQRYRQTAKGREAHRQAERRRRRQNPEKTMDDTSSTPVIGHDKLPQGDPSIVACCHFCGGKGVVVEISPVGGMGGGIRSQSQTILTFLRSIWKTGNLLFAIVSGK